MSDYLTPEQVATLFPRFNADWWRRELRAGRCEGFLNGRKWLTTEEHARARIEQGSNTVRKRRRRAHPDTG